MPNVITINTISGKTYATGGDGMAVQVEGLQELQKKMRGMQQRVAKKLQNQAARQAAYPVRDKAKALVPRGEGALHSAITVRAFKKTTRWQRKYLIGAQVVIGRPSKKHRTRGIKNAYYGSMLEVGMPVRGIQPVGFIRNAMKFCEDIVPAVYRSALGRALRGEKLRATKYRMTL